MEFEFSIRQTLRQSWQIFTKHLWFFITIAFVMFIFNIFSSSHHNVWLKALAFVAMVLWSYVTLSVTLAAVDGKEGMLSFDMLKAHLPTIMEFLKLIAVGVLAGLIIVLGFVLLIIPGVYFGVRLCFVNLAFVDRKGSVGGTLKYSWHLVKGDIFWSVFLVLIVAIALIFLGAIVFGVGMLVTYPIAMLLIAFCYRALTTFQSKQMAQQPTEVSHATSA
ncbi:MAG TPA: hypothetical protein VG982_02275 [Candidatus Paceibacterota bacterium]|nr:hypothetical protein [Candidatus Paceibacterota bacterium]